jgi:lysophospholipase L1-like esterase
MRIMKRIGITNFARLVGLLAVPLAAIVWFHPDGLKRVPIARFIPWRTIVGNTAIKPAARRAGPQHAADLESARCHNPKVIFLGDSLTNGWRRLGKPVWDHQLAPLQAAHLAVGEDRTQHLLYRLDAGEFDGLSPIAVVLLIGTNNVPWNTPREIDAAVAAVVGRIRASRPAARVLLLGILPRECVGLRRADLAEINQALADRFAADSSVRFLDLSERFEDAAGEPLSSLYCDGLHLCEAGYQVLADAILPVLRESLPKP